LGGKTTIESDPNSEQAGVYRKLAKHIIKNDNEYVPSPLEGDELKIWAESWSDKLLEQKETERDLECVVPEA
ncbi:MAG TPA: nitrogenase iron protein, partial [Methanobacterium sp.]